MIILSGYFICIKKLVILGCIRWKKNQVADRKYFQLLLGICLLVFVLYHVH